MIIHTVKSQYRNDFYATYLCEHCSHVTGVQPGYDDLNFHQRVIPGMHCPKCGKDRAGNIKQEEVPQ